MCRMREKLVAYGRFDCKNEKGFAEMLALVEYEDILGRDKKGQLIKTGEREYGCYDVLDNSTIQKGHYFLSLSALVEDSMACYGKYRGFRIYEKPRKIRKEG